MTKRFSDDEVEYIRHLRSVGFGPLDIARYMGTTDKYVISLCSGEYRLKAPGVLTYPKVLGVKAQFTEQDKQTIRKKRSEGTLIKVLAIDYNCNEGTISRICGAKCGVRRKR